MHGAFQNTRKRGAAAPKMGYRYNRKQKTKTAIIHTTEVALIGVGNGFENLISSLHLHPTGWYTAHWPVDAHQHSQSRCHWRFPFCLLPMDFDLIGISKYKSLHHHHTATTDGFNWARPTPQSTPRHPGPPSSPPSPHPSDPSAPAASSQTHGTPRQPGGQTSQSW